jgi:signal transduction histidine kinase
MTGIKWTPSAADVQGTDMMNRALRSLIAPFGLVAALLLEAVIDGPSIGLARVGVPLMFLVLLRRQTAGLVLVLTGINFAGHFLISGQDLAFSSAAALGDLTAVLVALGVQHLGSRVAEAIETPAGYVRAAGSMMVGSAVGSIAWWMTMSQGLRLPLDLITADILGVMILAPLVAAWRAGWPRNHPHKLEAFASAVVFTIVAAGNLLDGAERSVRLLIQAAVLVSLGWMIARAGRRFTSLGWFGGVVAVWIGLQDGRALVGHEGLDLGERMFLTRMTLSALGILAFTAVFALLAHQKLIRAARAGEARFRAIAEAAPDPMVAAGMDGRVRFANTRFTDLFGSAVRLQDCFPMLALCETIEASDLSKVMTAHVGDGKVISAEVSASCYQDERGTPIFAIIIRDITEREAREAELRQALQDLARTNTDLAQFAYAASHDLQEPLRTVASYVSLLEHRYSESLDERAGEYIGLATEGAARLQALVDDLLEYSKAATIDLTERPVPMRAALDDALSLLDGQIRAVGPTLEIGELPSVDGDPAAIAAVFQNMISNALKFRHDGRPPKIKIWSEEGPDGITVKVSDDGIGIPEEQRLRVLEPFHRLHPRNRYGGTGLGLAMARRIIERHGGTIWIEGTEGEGTTMCFTLRPAMRRIA